MTHMIDGLESSNDGEQKTHYVVWFKPKKLQFDLISMYIHLHYVNNDIFWGDTMIYVDGGLVGMLNNYS